MKVRIGRCASRSCLISGGSLALVMQGKHYDRVLHCHKVLLEALEELLLEKLYEDPSEIFSSLSHDAQRKINTLLQSPSPSILSEVLANPEIIGIIKKKTCIIVKQIWVRLQSFGCHV